MPPIGERLISHEAMNLGKSAEVLALEQQVADRMVGLIRPVPDEASYFSRTETAEYTVADPSYLNDADQIQVRAWLATDNRGSDKLPTLRTSLYTSVGGPNIYGSLLYDKPVRQVTTLSKPGYGIEYSVEPVNDAQRLAVLADINETLDLIEALPLDPSQLLTPRIS